MREREDLSFRKIEGQWLVDTARMELRKLEHPEQIDFVYAHNDMMAIAAREYFMAWDSIRGRDLRIIGVDAVAGAGLEAVEDRRINASFLYPTGGEQVIRTAMRIIQGEPVDKFIPLRTAPVDHQSARTLLLQADQLQKYKQRIEAQRSRIDGLSDRFYFLRNSLGVISLLMIGFIALSIYAFYINRKMRQANRKLISLNAEMKEVTAQKLQFFTNVSHEVRTPLSLILAPLDRLIVSLRESPYASDLGLIQKNANRLLRVINQILDFRKVEGKQEKLAVREIDLVPFVGEIKSYFDSMASVRAISYTFTSSIKQCTLWIDPDLLERVFFNLLSNAFKFTPEGGTISVTLSLRLEKEGENKLVIEVSDSGIGIPADKQGAIFDRFYQVSSPDKGNPVVGTGIGLHLCREFVRMHHGTITVKSEPGAGSTFTVTLPVIPLDNQDIISAPEGIAEGDILPPVEEHAEIADKDASPAGRPTLLVVDDNTDFREFMKISLSGVYSVLTAADGEDAWKLIPEELPDMVISDVMMPITDGITLCRRIKGDIRTSHIPVILLTAKSAKDSQLVGLEAGADDYISKPFNMEMLLLKVRHLIEMKKKMQKAFMQSSTMGIALTEVQASSMDEELMRKAIAYIEEQIANPELSVERLSREMGMSRVNFYKKCLSITGKTPVELIRTVRLKRAAQLLEKSQMRVNEVALECGFNDVKLFRKYFKDEFGRLPSDYHK